MKKLNVIVLIALMALPTVTVAQYDIKAPKGYSQNIGQMVSMLDDLKGRVERIVSRMDQEATDFLLDENANTPGAMIYHLAATEKYYQVYTFEGRQFNAEEQAEWGTALSLGEDARKEFTGKPIQYYLDIFNKVRKDTKKMLKEKDDTWFTEKNGAMTNHWAWFHVMEHQANHMGQLAMISKRI